MAQIPGFEYDIFISYTHNDNHSPTDAPGWVDRCHDELENVADSLQEFRKRIIAEAAAKKV